MNGQFHLDYTATGIKAHASNEVRQGFPAGRDQFPVHVEGEPDWPRSLHSDAVNPRLVRPAPETGLEKAGNRLCT